MFCRNCGAQIADGVQFCAQCGTALTEAAAPVQPIPEQSVVEPVCQQPVAEQPAYQQPVYQQPVYQQPMYQQAAYQQPVKPPANGLAIASLVLSIISIFLLPIVTGTLGIIFGGVAKSKGNKGGMATAGIVIGIIGIVGWLLVQFVFPTLLLDALF